MWVVLWCWENFQCRGVLLTWIRVGHWVNFQCRGVLLIWITVRQWPIVLAVGAGGGCLDICSLIYHFSFLSPSLWETARYRLKYSLKGPLSPKQPTYQPSSRARAYCACVRCGWGLVGHFFSRPSFLFSFSLFLYSGISLTESHSPPSLTAHKVGHPGGRPSQFAKQSIYSISTLL